jgi:hypothetical protein
VTRNNVAQNDPEPQQYSWAPQPIQKRLIDCPYPEILFGGARGGGKTDGILGKYAIKEKRWGPGFNAVFFRKEMPQQDDLIERAKEIYVPTGAKWQDQKKLFSMPHGGRIRFRPLESIADAEKYQGQSLSDAAVEEAGNYPMPAPIDRLFGCLRSSHGVPVQLILSANPGGPGHQWIKQRFIDPAPLGMKRLVRQLPNGKEHHSVYIPSRIGDNRILLAKDPDYVSRLYLVGSVELVRAWLEGDWNVIAGAYFPEFSLDRHVCAPFAIPTHWARIRMGDWGSARPFCILWAAVSDGCEVPLGSTSTSAEHDSHKDLDLGLPMRGTGSRWAAHMRGLPQRLHACLEEHASFEPGAEEESELQKLRACLSQAGTSGEAAMRAVWGENLADAPSRLRSALRHYLALPPLPPRISQGRSIPRGTLVIYREWYGWNGTANEGCHLTAQEVGQGIREREKDEKLSDEVLDPAAFARDGGPSIAERMDLGWRRADNSRVAKIGAMGGWDEVRQRLKSTEQGLLIFHTCTHIIRTLPALQHDPHKAEDVDTNGEDHAPDALRYGCMSRPVIRDKPKDTPRRFETDLTINELIKRAQKKRLAES